MKSEVDDAGRHKKAADGSEATLLWVNGWGHLAALGLGLRLRLRLHRFRATAYGEHADADIIVSIYFGIW